MGEERSGEGSGTLPATMTQFVGRRRELADVRRLLEQSRLVTLTGSGGVGKTRLALRVAGEVRRAFADGVRFVDLAVITDGARVAEAIAAALGVTDRSTRPALDKVVDHLDGRRMLLLIDNCEHVADDCARVVDRLLRATVSVRVLATSRHTLGVDGEYLFAVPPLAVPDLRLPQRAAVTGQFDAVQLLVDRVVAVHPTFAVTDANAASVARLCTQLDGIPLAIELAATRLRTLSVDQIVARLAGRFALLTGGSAAAQPRQQTLRALVDWSHSLCSPAQRLLWARLSVFNGSFDLAAAEGVCADAELPAEQILDVLDDLVAQSIVLTEHDPAGVRFRLLETIRQYGREQLGGNGGSAVLVRRHRDHYLGVVEEVAARWCGPHQQADLARLRADHGNLEAALTASLEATVALSAGTGPDGVAVPDPGPALRLVTGMRHHWYADDFLSEGRTWLDRALALAHRGDAVRTRALWVAAWVALLQGDVEAAVDRLDECEALAATVGDERSAAIALSLRGTAALFAGELQAASELFDAARRRLVAIGEVEALLWWHFQHAITLVHLGAGAAARVICEEALALSEAHGELLCRSYTLWVLGFESWRRGDVSEGERCVRRGLVIQRGFCDRVGAALMIEVLAWMAASAGEFRSAARRLAAAGVSWAAAGTTIGAFGPPLTVLHDACVARLQGAGVAVSGPWSAATPLGEVIDAVLADVPAGAGPAAGEAAPDGRVPVVPPPANDLTARELSVAELVADGLSNRAIAAELVISPRTVDGHVERILAKLGFASRTQVAAWVVARRGVRAAGA